MPAKTTNPPAKTTNPSAKTTNPPARTTNPPSKTTRPPEAVAAPKEAKDRSPAARLGRRPTTNPGRLSRRPTGNSVGAQDVIATPMKSSPTTMSVFSVRRVKLVNQNDERAKFRIDGISGGEDASLFLNVIAGKQLLGQVRELELLEKRTFVPAGRLAELIERELSNAKAG